MIFLVKVFLMFLTRAQQNTPCKEGLKFGDVSHYLAFHAPSVICRNRNNATGVVQVRHISSWLILQLISA